MVFLEGEVSVFIAEKINGFLLVAIGMSMVSEIVSFIAKGIPRNLYLPFFAGERFEDTAVLPEGMIDIAHLGVGIAVQVIVKVIPALVVAEFFICAPFDFGTAVKTAPLLHRVEV